MCYNRYADFLMHTLFASENRMSCGGAGNGGIEQITERPSA